MRTLSSEAVTVLGSMEVEGASARIGAGQLDRRLYLEVNAALEALGGKWNKKAKAHLFDGDPRDDIDRVVLSGGVEVPRAGKSWQQLFGFFETQPPLVERMLARAEIESGHEVLEPSAGRGAIARGVARYSGVKLTCVELQEENVRHLRASLPEARVEQADFLEWRSRATFDRVVANPPFARQVDIDHMQRALGLLRPGGRLVAIMSAGIRFRQNRKTTDFRRLVENWGGRIEDNPPDAFKESGTSVQTVMVTVDKPRAS